MCNLYSQTKGQQAIIALTRAMRDRTGNLPPLPGIFPDYQAPVVRYAPMLRWGMPTPQNFIKDAAARRAGKLRAKGRAANAARRRFSASYIALFFVFFFALFTTRLAGAF
jgi:putative SOS response-associated peptidase YedK